MQHLWRTASAVRHEWIEMANQRSRVFTAAWTCPTAAPIMGTHPIYDSALLFDEGPLEGIQDWPDQIFKERPIASVNQRFNGHAGVELFRCNIMR